LRKQTNNEINGDTKIIGARLSSIRQYLSRKKEAIFHVPFSSMSDIYETGSVLDEPHFD